MQESAQGNDEQVLSMTDSLDNGVAALGMIETLGLPALIAAADAAAKAAEIQVIKYEQADAGIVTLYITGDVSSVKAAIEAGEAAAKQVGMLRHTHVIPRPVTSLRQIIRRTLPQTQPNGSIYELQQKTVAELRKFARSMTGFPLSGREISKAGKDRLLSLLSPFITGRK